MIIVDSRFRRTGGEFGVGVLCHNFRFVSAHPLRQSIEQRGRDCRTPRACVMGHCLHRQQRQTIS
ncbi:hypothetical protein SBBP2_330002 [Burkholderiales bacterium]|nr:hypothetical protein SBBP2_330002 [Burkholderiales bacterium]